MKRLAVLSLVLASRFASAQPAPDQPPQPPPSPENPPPSWLPGVQDVTAGEISTPGKLTLSMARAVEIAVRQHPTLRIARAQSQAAWGRVDQARVPLHPTLSLSAGVTAGSRPNDDFLTNHEGLNVGASASWRITDFGLTKANVRAAEANADAANAGTASTILDVREQVELAYLEAIERARLIIVAQATVKSEEGHLDQAKRFVAAQAHDPIEVQQALSRAANAKSALSQAESNQAIALANLRSAIGWVDPARAPEVDTTWPVPSNADPGDLGALVETARKHRPDVMQLDKQIIAADASLTAAHAERRPVLSATAQALWGPSIGNDTWSTWYPQPTWFAGVTLSWLAFDGGKSHADVEVAEANLASAIASRDGLLVTLTSQLEASRSVIVSSRANVQASTEAVTAAQAQLKLADARYAQGLGSQIELADAQTAVTTAEGNLVSAEWQLATAWTTLKRQLGQ